MYNVIIVLIPTLISFCEYFKKTNGLSILSKPRMKYGCKPVSSWGYYSPFSLGHKAHISKWRSKKNSGALCSFALFSVFGPTSALGDAICGTWILLLSKVNPVSNHRHVAVVWALTKWFDIIQAIIFLLAGKIDFPKIDPYCATHSFLF